MGFWNDGLEDSRSRRRRSRSRSRSRSPSRKSHHGGGGGVYSRPSAARSASSFISSITGYSTASRAATPRRSNSDHSKPRGLFGFGSSNNKYNYGNNSRPRPRNSLVAKIRKWLRDIYHYMKRHPMKVFFLVIMPLITGGALTKILSTVGIRLPSQLQRMMGSSMNRGYSNNERYYARGGARDFAGGTNLPGMDSGGGLGGLGESAAGLMKMARMFM